MSVPQVRAAGVPEARPTWWERALRTPLLSKLILLDLVINAGAMLLLQRAPDGYVEELTILSLVVVLVLNAALVAWALRPLRLLEDTARRVFHGEHGARVNMPRLADRNLVRIGDTFDDLLDRVAAERGRVRALASQVVAAGDQERARIARELHDGIAQSLSALDMLLASTRADSPPEALGERLGALREIAREALSEVRALSHAVHPRVLDDLGLAAALEWLARRSRVASELDVVVECDLPDPLPPVVTSVLYRVAAEALHNATKHARARSVHVEIWREGDEVCLVVRDDGRGFDRAAIDAEKRGMGLFVMEERVSLVDGHLDIESGPDGTAVRARVPLRGAR